MFKPFEFRAGQPKIPSNVLNAIQAEIARLGKITVAPPLELRSDSAGMVFGINLPSNLRVAQTGASGIGARSGSTLGVAKVTLQYLKIAGTGTPPAVNLVADDVVYAYNWAQNAVASNAYIAVYQMSGVWMSLNEDCP